MTDASCPCGTGRAYAACCGRYHRGEAAASTAEQLMRSRYSAFALGDADYIATTWSETTRPDDVRLLEGQEWTGLTVVSTARGGVLDADGEVTFVARFRRRGRDGELRERSAFARELGRWVYVGPTG